MSIFTDRTIRLQAIVTMAILLCLILLGQLAVMRMADDYKQALIEHDYALAGYLARSGLDNTQLALAFTYEKTDRDAESGKALLDTAGYSVSTQSSLLPEVEHFYRRFAMTAFSLSIVFSVILLMVFYYFERCRNRRIEKAGMDIRRFMDGDTSIRLKDYDEGSLSRLFAAVNSMATSLTSHAEREKHNKEFLKDTISDISHQLKTPLAALQMYNEIIQDEKTGNEAVESFTAKNQRELERMETLIQSLLKLAKLDAGTIELEKSINKLKDFLEECLSGFITRAELEGKDLRLQCDDLIVLYFDVIWLKEAVGNIIKNALDHTHAGDRIEIECGQNAVVTEITIKDNGMGIHPEDIHHIFKRFYRSRFSKDRQGIGIGLALSKAIIEKHGGTITVESEPQNGTAFHLIFPKLSNL